MEIALKITKRKKLLWPTGSFFEISGQEMCGLGFVASKSY
jgi:hypothetical protein